MGLFGSSNRQQQAQQQAQQSQQQQMVGKASRQGGRMQDFSWVKKIAPMLGMVLLFAALSTGVGIMVLQLIDQAWIRIPKMLQLAAAIAGVLCLLGIGLHAFVLHRGTAAIIACIKAIAESWLAGREIRDTKTVWQLLLAFFAVALMVPIIIAWSLGKVTASRVPTDFIQDLTPKVQGAQVLISDIPAPSLLPLNAGIKTVHKVRKGETLGSIAARHNVSVDDIKINNGLRSDNIVAGQILTVKP